MPTKLADEPGDSPHEKEDKEHERRWYFSHGPKAHGERSRTRDLKLKDAGSRETAKQRRQLEKLQAKQDKAKAKQERKRQKEAARAQAKAEDAAARAEYRRYLAEAKAQDAAERRAERQARRDAEREARNAPKYEAQARRAEYHETKRDAAERYSELLGRVRAEGGIRLGYDKSDYEGEIPRHSVLPPEKISAIRRKPAYH